MISKSYVLGASLIGAIVGLCSVAMAGEPTTAPAKVQAMLGQFCLDCHDPSVAEGGVGMTVESIDWGKEEVRETWESVHEMIQRQMMPPIDADQPTEAQRKVVLDWLDRQLIRYSPIGDGRLRRLSRREYLNTIRDLFGLRDFELPATFPPDPQSDGFDNQTKNLVLSVSHLEAFQQTAERVADEFFGPARRPVDQACVSVPAEDLVISYSSACLIDQKMRLASRGILIRNGTWPTKFEAPANGVYRFELRASSLVPDDCPLTPNDHVPRLMVEVVKASGINQSKSRVVDTFDVPPNSDNVFRFDANLDRGETIALRYDNSPFSYDDTDELESVLQTLFAADTDLAMAWQRIGKPARGGNGWLQVKASMQEHRGEAGDADEIDESLIKRVAKNRVNAGETLVYRFFENGPWLAIDSIEIDGPIETFPDRDDVRRSNQRKRWLESIPDVWDNASLNSFIGDFLRDAYRRRVSDDEIVAMVDLFTKHREQTSSDDEAFHLLIRTVLISPSFLYRGSAGDTLNDDDLATRLSYFLTSSPPDRTLQQIANDSRLHHSFQLQKQSRRLLGDEAIKAFVRDFTDQWLDLSPVDRLMPDQGLIRQFSDPLRKGIKAEAADTFAHVLANNLSVRELIAPEFVITTPLVATTIYDLDESKVAKRKKNKKSNTKGVKTYAVPKFGRHGGLLCMASTMMATANGVDTQPVLRGVWVLDNIVGMPPPEPPDAVPALVPDITGASTPKQRLAAHMADASCAQCHREIDPMGFVLENFDPIGRWRESYPADSESKKEKSSQIPVDATGTLPDGTVVEDVTDLKRWLDEHPQHFVRTLSVKLMEYATGRELNYRERSRINEIVDRHAEMDFRLADLIVDLIDTPIFRMR